MSTTLGICYAEWKKVAANFSCAIDSFPVRPDSG